MMQFHLAGNVNRGNTMPRTSRCAIVKLQVANGYDELDSRSTFELDPSLYIERRHGTFREKRERHQ